MLGRVGHEEAIVMIGRQHPFRLSQIAHESRARPRHDIYAVGLRDLYPKPIDIRSPLNLDHAPGDARAEDLPVERRPDAI